MQDAKVEGGDGARAGYISVPALDKGAVTLSIEPRSSGGMKIDMFARSGWDAVSLARIELTQPSNGYVWSASLVYARREGDESHRWHEITFWSMAGATHEPFAVDDVSALDEALSGTIGVNQVAWGPAVVDDEAVSDFVDRWTWLFAQAIEGRIGPPRNLPLPADFFDHK